MKKMIAGITAFLLTASMVAMPDTTVKEWLDESLVSVASADPISSDDYCYVYFSSSNGHDEDIINSLRATFGLDRSTASSIIGGTDQVIQKDIPWDEAVAMAEAINSAGGIADAVKVDRETRIDEDMLMNALLFDSSGYNPKEITHIYFQTPFGIDRSNAFPLNESGGVKGLFDGKKLYIYTAPNKKMTLARMVLIGYKPSLEYINLTGLDTSSTRSFSDMFVNDEKLKKIDGLDVIDTSNAIDMGGMFYNCTSLSSLDISNFNTENVVNMSGMFYGCKNVNKLDLSNFNTSNVKYMHNMFYGCKNIENLNLSNFDTSKVESFDRMFGDCSSLKSFDLSNFDMSSAESIWSMFSGCTSIEELDFSNSNASNLIDISYMVYNCTSLKRLDISSFDDKKLIETNYNLFMDTYYRYWNDDVISKATNMDTIVCTKRLYDKIIEGSSYPANLKREYPLYFKSQPENACVNDGEDVSYSVDVKGDEVSYIWQWKSEDGKWSYFDESVDSSSATLTFKANEDINGYQYRCFVDDINGKEIISEPAGIKVMLPLSLDAQPESVIADLNSTVKFTVGAKGTGLKYQWQWRKGETGTWSYSTTGNPTTDTLTVTAISQRNGYQYRCIVRDESGKKVISDTATLTVDMAAITAQPESVSADLNSTVKFTVGATGPGIKYRWQWRNGETGTWADSTTGDPTTDTLTVTAASKRNGYQYRCIVKDENGEKVISDAATLTVKSDAVAISTNPKSTAAALDSKVKFTVGAIGPGLKYKWQWRKGETGTWSDSTTGNPTTDTLSVKATEKRNGYQYRCIVTDENGNEVASSAATLTIGITITSQPKSVIECSGLQVRFKVEATGLGLTYQWQWRDGIEGDWADSTIGNPTTNTLTVTAKLRRDCYHYRCIIKDLNGKTVKSSVAILYVRG